MSKYKDAFKQIILDRAKAQQGISTYRAVTVSAINTDGSVQCILDGNIATATPLYPVTIGQTAILCISPDGQHLSLIPTTPGPAAPANVEPPYFTGGLCRFMASQQVIQAPGDRTLFFLDDRDLDSSWLNTPGSARTFLVAAGAGGNIVTNRTTVLLSTVGKFSSDGIRVATVFFSGTANQWRVRVRNMSQLVQGDPVPGFPFPPAFFAKATIETDLLRPMSDSVALYQVVDVFVDQKGNVYWLERKMFINNGNSVSGAVADQVFLYTVKKGGTGAGPTQVAQWDTSVFDGGATPPGPGTYPVDQAFTLDALVDGPNAVVVGRLTNPLGVNFYINNSGPVSAGNYILPTIFTPGGTYSIRNDAEGVVFPVGNGPSVLIQSLRQGVFVRTPSTNKKCTLVLFLGGDYQGSNVIVKDDNARMFIVTGATDCDEEEFTNSISTGDVFLDGTTVQFNLSAPVGQPSGGLITDFGLHVRKWNPPTNALGPLTVDIDPAHYIESSPQEPVNPSIPTGPSLLNFFKDISNPQVQGVLTEAPGSLREVGP